MSASSIGTIASILNPVTIIPTIATGGAVRGALRGGLRGAAKGAAETLRDVATGGRNTSAVDEQKRLEAERRAQLASEAAARAEAKRRAETTGQRAGRGVNLIFAGGLGFGSGNAVPSRGNLFGN